MPINKKIIICIISILIGLCLFYLIFSGRTYGYKKYRSNIAAQAGTEELAYMEIICVMVYQLTKNLRIEEAKTVKNILENLYLKL